MRDHVIRIRASAAEVSKIKDLAQSRGLSISEMIRRTALGVRLPPRTFDGRQVFLLTRTLGELGRIGGNINQLARRANAGKLAGHDVELATTLSNLATLRRYIREIIE